MFQKVVHYHQQYINKFSNKILCRVGSIIGACSGLTYCLGYQSKASWNHVIEKTKQNSKELDGQLFDIFKYKDTNLFDYVIIPDAPLGVNMLTTGITGTVFGYIFVLYFPVTITGVVIFNVIRQKPQQPFWTEE